jgi:hypothetical protein
MFETIVNKILKRKVINSIKILGLGIKELVFDIELSEITINSIEYDKKNNLILLHIFKDDDFDIIYYFEDLSEKDKLKILKALEDI